jgi:hypothetical protein
MPTIMLARTLLTVTVALATAILPTVIGRPSHATGNVRRGRDTAAHGGHH